MENMTQPVMPTPDMKDVEENKVMAILSYLGILCLIPLLAKKDSPFAQYHAKQGLVLLLIWLAIAVVAWVPVIGWAIGFFGPIILLILSILGIVNVVIGKMVEIPVVGQFAKQIKL